MWTEYDLVVLCFRALLKATAVLALACGLAHPARAAEAGVVSATLRQRTLLDTNWLFHRGDVSDSNAVIAATGDDRQWQRVSLPHDYVLDESGQYSPTNARNHGYLKFEPAWYRKHFVIPESDVGKVLRLEFDGVFRDSQVWVNGQWLGRHPSGYTPFAYDITQAARPGADNVVVVWVDPREFEGWWYEGGGIYRHVHYTALDPVHVATWGTYVVSEVHNNANGAAEEADLTVQTTVQNEGLGPANCGLVSEIIGPDGLILQTLKANAAVAAASQQQVVQHARVRHPRLWSVESPFLYRLRTTLLRDGRPVDAAVTRFGIRTIAYDAEKGFFLNGRHVEIQGVACHQDFAGVGIAVPDSLQSWRVRQLKQMGCNAWRTAHNPPSEALLEACDELGMLVMDENRHLGDAYSHHSPKGTTATNLSDLATMIQRDRNHPSIIMWSMCNEEGLQGTEEGSKLFSAMAAVVHRYDRTRPVTCAMNNGWLKPGIADVEDLIGINYNPNRYDAIHQRHPAKALFGSEDTNQKTTRGEYVEDRNNGWCSAYNLSDQPHLAVLERSFMCGSFTWTGFDYKGEPNPFGWPDISNNTGLMDVCGFPKDKYYYFESCWLEKPMVHVLPAAWNWAGKEGQNIRVIAFSNEGEVELLLNGKSLGRQRLTRGGHAEWQVAYQPGKLMARAYTKGKVVATDTVETTGVPVQLRLSPERRRLQADGQDAVVVPVSVLDAQGRVVPDASNRVSFQLIGNGRILGVGNGNPSDHDSDKAEQRNAFHGRCMAVLEAGDRAGELELTVSSPGLRPASISFRVRPE